MKGKVIAISGGTSGIGLATARILIGYGAKVVLGGRSKERGMAALAELGESANFISVDVRDERDAFAWLDQVLFTEGRLDGLVIRQESIGKVRSEKLHQIFIKM